MQWPWLPNMGQNLKPFIDIGDVPYAWKLIDGLFWDLRRIGNIQLYSGISDKFSTGT